MKESDNQQLKHFDDQIDLRAIFESLWKGKWIIIAVTLSFSLISVVYALKQPNIYRAEALLAPAEDSGGMNIPGQLGGLAALAGVNLGRGGGLQTQLTLEILRSREFLSKVVNKHSLKVPLMAVEGWNGSSREVIIDKDIYDRESDSWVRNVVPPKTAEPSDQEVYARLLTLISASQDQQTGLVRIAVKHYSPDFAADLVSTLIEEINIEMRQREVEEAQSAIEFLEGQLQQTTLTGAQSMLYSLIEEQTKTLMLANARPEYALETIDRPVIPEFKSEPKRAVIVIFGTILGGLLSCIFVLGYSFYRKTDVQ